MTLVTTPLGEGFTLADWEAMPDDGRRYELIGGTIIVSPTPATGHQRGSRCLQRLLEDAAPPDHEVFNAPVGLRLPEEQMVEPDLVVVPHAGVGENHLTLPVLLVVEIVSPGSRTHDKVTKRAVYAEAGIEHYWLVDGTGARPRFTALRLADGEYDTVLDTGGRVELDTPLCVAFSTPDLFRRPR
jgi:Uma2 family endonuclease